jgi:pimeloyl-ACP methyl ester carboxylesterase
VTTRTLDRRGRAIKSRVKGKVLAALLAACAALPEAAARDPAGPRRGAVGGSSRGSLVRTETIYHRSQNPIDHFTVHRIVSRAHGDGRRGAILFFPPLGFDFDFYEVSDTGNWADSAVAHLAALGYDVYGYSPGTRELHAGDCESGQDDCSVLAKWGLQSIVEDARFIRTGILRGGQARKPFVAGVSAGAMAALAALNDAPDAYAGAILWEGALYSGDAQVRALNDGWCQIDRDLLAKGQIFDDALEPFVRYLVLQAQMAPDQATTVPGYPPGTTNYQVYVLFMSSPPQAPVTALVPGLQFLAADANHARLTNASDPRVFEAIAGVNDYVPNAFVRDMNCSLAGDRTFTGNLGAFRGPVLAAAAGLGFGQHMQDTLALLGSDDVAWTLTEGLGHEEHFMSKQHATLLEVPLARWLASHTGCHEGAVARREDGDATDP